MKALARQCQPVVAERPSLLHRSASSSVGTLATATKGVEMPGADVSGASSEAIKEKVGGVERSAISIGYVSVLVGCTSNASSQPGSSSATPSTASELLSRLRKGRVDLRRAGRMAPQSP